jgi:endonuclease I
VIVVAAAVVVALTSLGGSSAKTGTTATSTAKATKTHARSAKSAHHAKAAPAVSPAETNVAVLNGTETTGLAHRIAGDLQQGGYSQANALDGTPPGSGQVTVVEYASGHQAEAEGVAHSLSVKQVQPLESAVSALAGSAPVVVIVGADKDHEASSP